MTIGERIKERREALGMSQTDLASYVGIGKQLLFKYEKNIVTNIPSDKIERIAEILQTTPAYLMGWNDETSTERFAEQFSSLSKDQQQDVIRYMEFLKSRHDS